MTRQKGLIQKWDDARGFGFIRPAGSNGQVFLHISALTHRNRRPAENDAVSYRLARDPKGRAKAIDVEYLNRRTEPRPGQGLVLRKIGISSMFMMLLLTAVTADLLPPELLGLYFVTGTLAFIMYWYDKSAARTSRWRTAENTLHFVDLLGGWPGSLIAMEVFRHKSRKASFQRIFWVTVMVNCGVLAWLISPAGARLLAELG
ncbi:MAG: cold shock and DUF1294 domain-containing protein [Pseudomonadales bacterium]|nr:cold shock and DUF1294 domain-containing protein [Pseudomonadales bacterium]